MVGLKPFFKSPKNNIRDDQQFDMSKNFKKVPPAFFSLYSSCLAETSHQVMNMIVGVLVEVVGIVAAAEQEASTRKSLLESLKEARGVSSTWEPVDKLRHGMSKVMDVQAKTLY